MGSRGSKARQAQGMGPAVGRAGDPAVEMLGVAVGAGPGRASRRGPSASSLASTGWERLQHFLTGVGARGAPRFPGAGPGQPH